MREVLGSRGGSIGECSDGKQTPYSIWSPHSTMQYPQEFIAYYKGKYTVLKGVIFWIKVLLFVTYENCCIPKSMS